ncbi:hypothetical protein DFH07DRAFT_833518 [Mycena maculata]|uniref:Uncharacterized protein n=1 Tax=Mycena maculata TaxID=230809 RepID=A0AAD7HRD5_9AGAR|nr:hypothetical protein DFH07DRAFT_852655 [Mycena maculata]KAJ7745593.1 hypothetical protein DFH07DRAFT_833518 [Mycena maculata]
MTFPSRAHFSLAALACHLQASQLYIPTMRGCPGVVFRFCLSWTHMFLCWVQVIQTDTFFFGGSGSSRFILLIFWP